MECTRLCFTVRRCLSDFWIDGVGAAQDAVEKGIERAIYVALLICWLFNPAGAVQSLPPSRSIVPVPYIAGPPDLSDGSDFLQNENHFLDADKPVAVHVGTLLTSDIMEIQKNSEG